MAYFATNYQTNPADFKERMAFQVWVPPSTEPICYIQQKSWVQYFVVLNFYKFVLTVFYLPPHSKTVKIDDKLLFTRFTFVHPPTPTKKIVPKTETCITYLNFKDSLTCAKYL